MTILGSGKDLVTRFRSCSEGQRQKSNAMTEMSPALLTAFPMMKATTRHVAPDTMNTVDFLGVISGLPLQASVSVEAVLPLAALPQGTASTVVEPEIEAAGAILADEPADPLGAAPVAEFFWHTPPLPAPEMPVPASRTTGIIGNASTDQATEEKALLQPPAAIPKGSVPVILEPVSDRTDMPSRLSDSQGFASELFLPQVSSVDLPDAPPPAVPKALADAIPETTASAPLTPPPKAPERSALAAPEKRAPMPEAKPVPEVKASFPESLPTDFAAKVPASALREPGVDSQKKAPPAAERPSGQSDSFGRSSFPQDTTARFAIGYRNEIRKAAEPAQPGPATIERLLVGQAQLPGLAVFVKPLMPASALPVEMPQSDSDEDGKSLAPSAPTTIAPIELDFSIPSRSAQPEVYSSFIWAESAAPVPSRAIGLEPQNMVLAPPPQDLGATAMMVVTPEAEPISLAPIGQSSVTTNPGNQPAYTSPVAQIVAVVSTQQAGTVELRLSPEELGHVMIDMRKEGEVMVVQISAERNDTLDLLKRNSDQLAAELRASGQLQINMSFGRWTGSGQGNEGAPPNAVAGGPFPHAGLPAQDQPFRPRYVPQSGLYLRI